jgi:hypothetical protein
MGLSMKRRLSVSGVGQEGRLLDSLLGMRRQALERESEVFRQSIGRGSNKYGFPYLIGE